VENFRHQLNNTTASGDTALWDAIALSHDQLVEYAGKFPNAKLRIICISDGEDTKSIQKAQDVSMNLMRDKVVLDSISLGDESNDELQTLAYLTGGYKFRPDSMEEAMAICELEPVLSQLERPDIILPRHARRHLNNPWARLERAKDYVRLDEVSRDVYPQRKPHPGLSESFVEFGSFSRKFSMENRTDGNLRFSRIHSEIRNSGAKPHPHYDVYVCEPNFGLWKIVMQGPPESTYADGTFLLYLEMGEDYPAFAPKARFITPVYHPNINRHGRICHSILDRNWTVDTTNKDVLDTIYSLLLVPEFSDPMQVTLLLFTLHFRARLGGGL
jgi:ubiquitin-protein ligase